MKLSALLREIPDYRLEIPEKSAQAAQNDPDIKSIHYRAQTVKPDGIFIAIKGFKADGHEFVEQAVERGAAAVIVEQPIRVDIPAVRVEDSRKAMAALSHAFYGHPSEKMCIIGVTGTNGKTTTAYLIEAILAAAGKRTGIIGTIDYRYAGNSYKNPVTTPESAELQRILSEMHSNGVTHVVMEVSSHAIDLHRIDRCYMDVGVFTNLSQDHLDFHQTMDAYWSSKKKMFTGHLPQGPKRQLAKAVLNCRNPYGRELTLQTTVPTIKIDGDAAATSVHASAVRIDLNGVHGDLHTPAGKITVNSHLIGEHNLENIMCAAGAGIALQMPLDAIKNGIERTLGVPGRLERVINGCGKHVFVDYSHTPDALEHALSTLSALSRRRIFCVFGCGGDRDRQKRPIMGAIAARYADRIIITSDNPRSEEPMKIIDAIVGGALSEGVKRLSPSDWTEQAHRKGFYVEPDRRAAIGWAIAAAESGDVILIAGKGHEDYQIIGDRTIPFDDRTVCAGFLAETVSEGC